MSGYSPYQFAAFRFFLGLGCFVYFLLLPAYAPELADSGAQGPLLSELGLPNPFAAVDRVSAMRGVLIALALTAALLALGFWRRMLAVVLAIAFIGTANKLPLVLGPQDGYLFYLLLASMYVPHGEALTLFPMRPRWQPAAALAPVATALFAFGLCVFVSQRIFDGQDTKWTALAAYAFCAFGILFPRTRALAGLAIFPVFALWPTAGNPGLKLVAFAAAILALDRKSLLPWQEKAKKPADIFIDGECVLCNGFAEFVLAEDIHRFFRIASLQGMHAKTALPERLRGEKIFTVVLKDGERIHEKSGAALRVLGRLGGVWTFAYVFLLIPPAARNFIYGIVARHRYKIFGKFAACRLPSAEERGRVLD